MTVNVYQVGDLIRMSAAFTDIDDVAQDPAGVEFKIRAPGGGVTTYIYDDHVELVKDEVGNYHVDYLLSAPGRYRYRFAGVTTGQAAAEGELRVQKSVLD